MSQETIKETLSLETALSLVENPTYLTFVDRNDSLDHSLEKIQESIQAKCFDVLYEHIGDVFVDQEMNNMLDYKSKLKYELKNQFPEEDVEEFFDENSELIEEKIYDNNKSGDTIKDLLRNTSNIVTAYNTGYEVAPDSWSWPEKRVKQEVQNIKRVLGLKISSTEYNSFIDIMVRQASYGGKLVVYFYLDPTDIFEFEKDYTHIHFSNAHIAIVDMSGGSGDSCHLYRSEFTMEFKNKNLFFDKCVRYSYTYDVCGMISSWCEDTSWELINKKPTKRKGVVAEDNSISEHLEQQKKYQLAYNAGGCTRGDADITRHRNVSYLNDFPCGNKCHACGQFWVD